MNALRRLHAWPRTAARAMEIQKSFAGQIVRKGRIARPRLFAGADLAFSPDGTECVAAVLVWDALRDVIVEQRIVWQGVRFPYVPGLLSFREAPALLAAIQKLRVEPDVFMFDGQGFAHPRRFGLASHVGLWLDRPSVGCAKSILIGTHEPLGVAQGSTVKLMDGDECIGMALRTREAVKPVYVSVGHRLSLEAAVEVTLAACNGFRIPEPTRLADKLVAQARSEG